MSRSWPTLVLPRAAVYFCYGLLAVIHCSDLRVRFDYTSLSTDELDRVAKLSILVLSDEFGGVVREASPPKR